MYLQLPAKHNVVSAASFYQAKMELKIATLSGTPVRISRLWGTQKA